MQRPWVSSLAYGAALTFLIRTRRERGVSQRELAARIGKSRSFITKIEGRERRIDVVEFVAIARALGVAPGVLLDELAAELPDNLDF